MRQERVRANPPAGSTKIQHDGFRDVALKQDRHCMIWLPSDACWNLHAT
jgi:hypothetical protein